MPHTLQHVIRKIQDEREGLRLKARVYDDNNNFSGKKVKLSLCFNTALRQEGVLRSGVTATRILDFGTRWK